MGISVDNGTLLSMQSLLPSIDLFWHVGDLSYADDYLFAYVYLEATAGNPAFINATYEGITESWMNSMTPLWNQRPYMVLPGSQLTAQLPPSVLSYCAQQRADLQLAILTSVVCCVAFVRPRGDLQ